jgi:hypothetical protein
MDQKGSSPLLMRHLDEEIHDSALRRWTDRGELLVEEHRRGEIEPLGQTRCDET